MGYGAPQKGGGMTARQKGGGGFSPQMPSRPMAPPQDLSQALGQGIVALGGKGGGMNVPQRSPYMTPMQQMQPTMTPEAGQLARDSGLQVGPTPGQQADPFSGMSIPQRQAMNEQMRNAQVEAAQRARQGMMNRFPAQAQQQAMAQALMGAGRQNQARLMQPSMRQTPLLPNQAAMQQALLARRQMTPSMSTLDPNAGMRQEPPSQRVRAAYMPVDQGDGTDQFGAKIQTEPMGRIAGGIDTDQLRDRMSSKGGARTARQTATPAFSSTKGGARSAVQGRSPRAVGSGIASLASGKGGSRTMRQ